MAVEIVEAHRADLTALRRLAVSDLSAVSTAIRALDPAEAREVLKAVIPDLMDPFLGAASDAATVLLDELYVLAGQRPPPANPAVLLEPARVDSLPRWAVAPMADEALDSTVLTRLTGSATRMIFDQSRITMQQGVGRHPDGRRVEFQRMPRADCCAFCGLLASRPSYMAYRTETSAGRVIGRGSERTGLDAAGKRLSGGIGGGVKQRGEREISEKFHDDCRCLAVPILRGATADAISATQLEYEDLYAEVASENDLGQRDLKASLKKWRAVHGAR